MEEFKSIQWEVDGAWLGYLEEYPDYWTQGQTLKDLEEHLVDLFMEIRRGSVPGVRKADDPAV